MKDLVQRLKAHRATEYMCQDCYGTVMDEAAEEIINLRLALLRLSNEIFGSMPMMEELCRREFGNTNYAVIMQRAQEARDLVKDV